MADPQILVPDSAQVLSLFTEVNNELRSTYDNKTVAQQMAWVRTGKLGLVTKFPLQLVSNSWNYRAPGEPTPFRKVEEVVFSCETRELDTDAYFIAQYLLQTDIYGIVEPNVQDMMARAPFALDQVLAAAICANPVTSYDGLAYWQTAANHPYNPLRPKLGKFANKYTATAISRASLTQSLDYFNNMVGFDGEIEHKPGKIWLIVATKDQASRARKFIQEGLIASDAGTASESTTLKDEFEGVIVFPELGSAKYGGNKKFWMAVRVASDRDRPFVINVAMMPEAYIDGLNPSDYSRVVHRGVRYGWRANMGASFLWPQNAVLFVEP